MHIKSRKRIIWLSTHTNTQAIGKIQKLVKVEEHDRAKKRKSTRGIEALTPLPSDEPFVDGTDFDPPPTRHV